MSLVPYDAFWRQTGQVVILILQISLTHFQKSHTVLPTTQCSEKCLGKLCAAQTKS